MIFADAHVHIYDCFDVEYLFDSAWRNFQAAAEGRKRKQKVFFVLLLTEGATENWFHTVQAAIGREAQGKINISPKWSAFLPEGEDCLRVYRHDCPEEKMDLVGGRQVVTKEKIEVLALYCQDPIANGLPLDETVTAIEQCGGIPVLPWGVGKWIGKRGKIIQRFLTDNSQRCLFLGDNGGRPLFWPTPALFRNALAKGIAVLPGTDPLPIPEEAARVGSYGFCLDEETADCDSPVTCLKNALLSGKEIVSPFGGLLNNRLFFLNQLRLRFSS